MLKKNDLNINSKSAPDMTCYMYNKCTCIIGFLQAFALCSSIICMYIFHTKLLHFRLLIEMRILVDQLHLGYLGDGLLNGVVRRAINRLLGGDFIGLAAKRAFRFLVSVFGFILDNLDPFNLFPLKKPIESNPTRNYDL